MSKHACIACACAAVGRGRLRRIWKVCPPVFSFATIFGTIPSWCSASRVRPWVTCATPSIDAICVGGGLLERQLRPRQEEVVDEMRAGLAELREVGDHRLVRLQQIAVAAPAAGPPKPTALILLRLQRHGQVGADPRERVQRLLLRLVEPVRQARDRDDERDPQAEAEQRQDRACATPDELVAQVADVEHVSKQITPA